MIPQSVRSLIRKVPTVAPVPHRSVLSVTGSQAGEFLNGVLASSVLASQGHFFSAFLHAQGRVLHDVFVYSKASPEGKQSYLIEYDPRPSEAPPLLSMLKRYVLRSKVRLRDVSDEYDIWQAWGSEEDKSWETDRRWNTVHSGAIEPIWDGQDEWPWGREPNVIRDRRAVGMGRRLLVRKGDRPQYALTHDLQSQDAYTLHRILHGVPEGNIDISPTHAFPMDSNLDIMGGLDFRKGCYVGQELTVRTYHTGLLRKRVLPIVIRSSTSRGITEAANVPAFPTDLDIRTVRTQHSADSDSPKVRPRGTGKLLSSTQGVGLALLRLGHVQTVERGEASFQFEMAGMSGDSITWTVEHWHPFWWPALSLKDSD